MPNVHDLAKRREAQRRYAASLHGLAKRREAQRRYAASLHGKDKISAYNAEYPNRKSQKIEGQNTLMQAWEKARAPSASAVLPPRFILQGVALASPDSIESQVGDTEDPWELQRLHDAWLAKEFFYKKKKNYLY